MPDAGTVSGSDVIMYIVVGVAQLVRAPDCGSGGRGFESHHPPQIKFNAGVAKLAHALG